MLIAAGLECDEVYKLDEGRPNILDFIANEDVSLVINTPSGKGSRTDRARIRSLAIVQGIPCFTTLSGATAAVNGIAALKLRGLRVRALQDFYALQARVPAQRT